MRERQPHPLARRVLAEMRVLRDKEPFVPTADIDMVWVISGPGTVEKAPTSGPYAKLYEGTFPDRTLIFTGIDMVKSITGLRIDKNPTEVTKEQVDKNGPIFYYNGEDLSHPNANFPQNEDMRALLASGTFPLPNSKVKIHDLVEINTPGQIYEALAFLTARPDIKKIAMISSFPQMRRVMRYLNQHRSLIPPSV